jgi:4-methylaminobutanoate oxidase (formaldehyde-forming)
MMDTDYLVIGAGVWGTSIAHHLVRDGAKDVTLLDRFDVADGSTWAAAGFVGQVRHRERDMRLISRSAKMYAAIEETYPGAIGWKPVGSLRIARTDARAAELTDSVPFAAAAGVASELVGPDRLAEIAPMLALSDVTLATWVASDGSVVPEKLARYFADTARGAGASVLTSVEATRITRITDGYEVQTSTGAIRARTVILAAGLYTSLLSRTIGIELPLSARRASYLITAPIDDASVQNMPTFRDPDHQLYMRAADARVLIGATRMAKEYRLPENVEIGRREHVAIDGHLGGALADATASLPAIGRAGIASGVAAFEGATPDSRFLAGEVAPGLWVCAGGEGYGIAAAGGLGEEFARAVMTGDRSALAPYDPVRFGVGSRLDSAGLDSLLAAKTDRFAVSPLGGA